MASNLSPAELSRILNADKLLLNGASDICFRRCILSFEKEHLNSLEQNCIDRCLYKFDQVVQEVNNISNINNLQ